MCCFFLVCLILLQTAIPVLIGTKFDDFIQLPIDLQWTISSEVNTSIFNESHAIWICPNEFIRELWKTHTYTKRKKISFMNLFLCNKYAFVVLIILNNQNLFYLPKIFYASFLGFEWSWLWEGMEDEDRWRERKRTDRTDMDKVGEDFVPFEVSGKG